MNFFKTLVGGAAIMVVSLVIGIAQNAVRSNPIDLIPKAPRPKATTPKQADAATQRDPVTGVISQSPAVTDEELDIGEITMERVKLVWEAGTAIIIDARGHIEFDEGHIPGALNIPIDEFVDHYEDLDELVPLDATVIAYCTSVTCDMAERLAREMALIGYERVVVYRGGWEQWSEAGHPAEAQ